MLRRSARAAPIAFLVGLLAMSADAADILTLRAASGQFLLAGFYPAYVVFLKGLDPATTKTEWVDKPYKAVLDITEGQRRERPRGHRGAGRPAADAEGAGARPDGDDGRLSGQAQRPIDRCTADRQPRFANPRVQASPGPRINIRAGEILLPNRLAAAPAGSSYSAASSIRASSSNNRSTVRRMCRRAASVAMSTNAASPSSVRRSC
jgi:hypothetical protein